MGLRMGGIVRGNIGETLLHAANIALSLII